MEKQVIHILTLSWNGANKLKRLSGGLIKNIKNSGCDAVWHIRDNGSNDGTKEWIEGWNNKQVDISPLFIDHNRDNFAKGVNSLFLKASPKKDDLVLLLNNDIDFDDAISIKNMIDLIRRPNIGVVGARLLYSNSDRLQHAGTIFGPRYGNMPYHFRHKEKSDKHAEKNRYFQAVTAACCLIKVCAFQNLDEKFYWAFEDVDLNLRIGSSGYKIAYCGKTKIFHEESSSLNKNPVNKLFLSQNVKHFKEKWFGKYKLDHEKYLKDPEYKIIK